MTPRRAARPPKQRKRARCAAFEAHHRGIQAALAPITSYGGNLIATLDFFRDGAKYYKVTEKVDLAGLDRRPWRRLDFPAKLVLLKTVAHSLRILHDLDIVHSDLKPSNVLIKKTELGYTTKLIDFDSSYIVGSPPPPDEIVGTMNYYSPELVRYIQGTADGAELTEASDVFALGLIYCRIPHRTIAGIRPGLPRGGDRGPQRVHASASPGSRTGTDRGSRRTDAARRPGRPTHHRTGPRTLMGWRSGAPTTAAPLNATPDHRVRPAAASSLRGKGLRLTGNGHQPATGTMSPGRLAPIRRPFRFVTPISGSGGRPAEPPPAAGRIGRETAEQAGGASIPVNTIWRCGVCETVNHGGRTCSACGASLTRRSTVATVARARVSPPVPAPPAPAPVREPVRRAINREPVAEEEWEEYENSIDVLPIPGGCLFTVGPKTIILVKPIAGRRLAA